ncbi:MAG: YggT family protein [Rickettsiales bacterium]|nr:YggT family protein [Rickettsiales bacterium]
MMIPFIELILSILHIYSYIVIAWVILSVLISFEIINRFNQVVQKINYVLDRLVEPALKPIRKVLDKILPNLGGVDLSPLALLLLINFAQSAVIHWIA